LFIFIHHHSLSAIIVQSIILPAKEHPGTFTVNWYFEDLNIERAANMARSLDGPMGRREVLYTIDNRNVMKITI